MEPPSTPTSKNGDLDPRWQGLCQHIHVTDDISFKLLALVPLVSIAGIAATLLKDTINFTPVVALLSLFAAAVTLALWIWERRNIQICMWLIARAADLEKAAFGIETPGQFFARPTQPGGQGKRTAEKLVYGLTIGAWLLVPAAVFASQWRGPHSAANLLGAAAYASAAGWLGSYAWGALNVDIDIKADFEQQKCKEGTN